MSKRAEIRGLLDEVKADEYAKYSDDWQGRAVACLNEIYFDNDRYDDEIYDLSGDMWEELVKYNLDTRGWTGLLFFFGDLRATSDWAYIDAYGNAKELTGDDLAGLLADELDELESDESDDE